MSWGESISDILFWILIFLVVDIFVAILVYPVMQRFNAALDSSFADDEPADDVPLGSRRGLRVVISPRVASSLEEVTQHSRSRKPPSPSPSPVGVPGAGAGRRSIAQQRVVVGSPLDEPFDLATRSNVDASVVKALMSGSPAPSEVSAPYEVPQYPIEQIQTRLAMQKHFSRRLSLQVETERRLAEHATAPRDKPSVVDESVEYQTEFQRVIISGEHSAEVPVEDLQNASQMLVRALAMREQYMSMSQQWFPPTAGRFLRTVPASATLTHGERKHIGEHSVHAPSKDNPWDVEWPPPLQYTCHLESGIFRIRDEKGRAKAFPYPDLDKFFDDFAFLCTIIADGPL